MRIGLRNKKKKKGKAMNEAEKQIAEQFGGEDIKSKISEFAEGVAIEMDAVDKLKKEHTRRKEALDAAKAQLHTMLKEAGMQSCKLDCGLTPSASMSTKYYSVAGLNTEEFFEWLKDNNLADIIKPTVSFMTLQSTLKEFEAQGGEVPESVVKKSDVLSVRMGGKAAYLLSVAEGGK
jgi:hypothetical protein